MQKSNRYCAYAKKLHKTDHWEKCAQLIKVAYGIAFLGMRIRQQIHNCRAFRGIVSTDTIQAKVCGHLTIRHICTPSPNPQWYRLCLHAHPISVLNLVKALLA